MQFKPQYSNPDSPIVPGASDFKTKGMGIEPSSPKASWEQWKMLLQHSDFEKIPIVTRELSRSLQSNPDPAIYDAIAAMLWQADVSTDKKALILDLLSEIATPESLEQLLDLTAQGIDSDLYFQVLQAISRIGDNHWQGRYHDELAPVLLTAWADSTSNDPAFYNAIGKAIAKVGDPQGVNELLLALSSQQNLNQSMETAKIKQQVAFNAIPQIRNPDAIAILGAWFAQEPIGAPAFEVSGTALAEIGSPEATQKILDWAKTAPIEGVRNLQDWLSKIDDFSTLPKTTAAETFKFQTPEIETLVNRYATGVSTPALTTPADAPAVNTTSQESVAGK